MIAIVKKERGREKDTNSNSNREKESGRELI